MFCCLLSLLLACPVVAEDVSVEEFLRLYKADADRMQEVYENSVISKTIGERLITVTGSDGQWVSEFEAAGHRFVEAYTTKGRFNLVMKEGWTPRKVIAHPESLPFEERQIRFNGDEVLDAYCWNGRPLAQLLAADGHSPFTSIQKENNLYHLKWHYTYPSDVTIDGVLTLDADQSFAVVKSVSLAQNDLNPEERKIKGITEYSYSKSHNGVPLLSARKNKTDQPDGSVSESISYFDFDFNSAIDADRFQLTHYRLSENLWIANRPPTSPFWEKIPGWAYFIALGIAFFCAAAYSRRKSLA